jgi:dimethylargininase
MSRPTYAHIHTHTRAQTDTHNPHREPNEARQKMAATPSQPTRPESASSFVFRGALVRGVAASLPAAALRQDAAAPAVDLVLARRQHAAYVNALLRVVPTVVTLPADEGYPDSVFVEDTAVCLDGVALITRLGHGSRRGEGEAVAAALAARGLRLVRMTDDSDDNSATLDGGDVLWTGTEFFVGLSRRTNDGGVRALTAAFPGRRVTPVHVTQGLHLKSFCAMAAPGVVAIGASEAAQAAQAAMEAASPGQYRFVRCERDSDANCVAVNGVLLHAPGAALALHGVAPVLVPIANDQLARVDGALTCCSLLF